MTADRFSMTVSKLLLVGVVTSGLLIIIGMAGAVVVGWTGSLSGAPYPTTDPTDFSEVIGGMLALQPIAFAQAGLITLVATPVARIALSVVAFGIEGDPFYTVISLAILVALLLSLFVIR